MEQPKPKEPVLNGAPHAPEPELPDVPFIPETREPPSEQPQPELPVEDYDYPPSPGLTDDETRSALDEANSDLLSHRGQSFNLVIDCKTAEERAKVVHKLSEVGITARSA